MITNSAGDVAIAYYQIIEKVVTLRNGHSYVFSPYKVISMAWIRPEDVEEVLAIPYGCCGQKRSGAFYPATQQMVDIWTKRN